MPTNRSTRAGATRRRKFCVAKSELRTDSSIKTTEFRYSCPFNRTAFFEHLIQAISGVKPNCLDGSPALTELKLEMSFFDHSMEIHLRGDRKNRLRITRPKRTEPLNLRERLDIEFIETSGAFGPKGALVLLILEFGKRPIKGLSELLNSIQWQTQSSRMPMPAESQKMLRARPKRRQNILASKGPDRALSKVFTKRDHRGGSSKRLRHSGRHYPDNALMPSRISHYDPVLKLPAGERGLDSSLDLVPDLVLGLGALMIDAL